MKFRAYIDQGHWTNQLHRLARAMGKSLEEAVKQQAGLVTLDAMLLTPPFPSEGGGGSKALKSSWPAHRKAGEAAVARDLKRVFRPASNWTGLSTGKGRDNRADQAAKLARSGDLDGIKALFKSGRIKRVVALANASDAAQHKAKRNRRGHVSPSFRGILVHTGRVPTFEQRREGRVEKYGGLQGLYRRTIKAIGFAKAGWLKAAQQLGVAKRVPAWVRRHSSAPGVYRPEGKDLMQAVTVGNAVPYIQEAGRELQIVRVAMAGRSRLMEKQIAQTLRKRKVAK